MEVIYDARLAETDAGDWTDKLFSEVQAQAPELFAKFLAGDPSFAFPGGESFAQQEERVAAALARGRSGRAAGARDLSRDGDPRRAVNPRGTLAGARRARTSSGRATRRRARPLRWAAESGA